MGYADENREQLPIQKSKSKRVIVRGLGKQV
jgi:hypothetical protein